MQTEVPEEVVAEIPVKPKSFESKKNSDNWQETKKKNEYRPKVQKEAEDV